MTAPEIMQQLASLGSETTKNVFLKHGAREPYFGVKVSDLKPIQKKIKKDYELSKALYSTGNSDAMYLAGLIADEKAMTKEDLQSWARAAYWYMISEYTVAWVTAESRYGTELALEWIDADEENIAAAGWATWANLVTIKPDAALDLQCLSSLLERVAKQIHLSPNRVRYTMNGFVIAVGCSVASLTSRAKEVAAAIGKVQVDMGGTACKVPEASVYIHKVEQQNKIGRKKKTARC